MRKFMSLLLGILLLSGVVEAAELPIGPMMFKLGESRATVLAEAQTRFALVPVGGNPDMIFLSSGEPPNAKIVVAKAVQSALSSAASASGSRATITTEEKQVPGTDFRSTYFQFPGHKVSITVADSNDTSYGQQVTVDESISL